MKSNKDIVYKIVTRIPKGKVSTYGRVGEMVNLHPRVVGMVLHKNTSKKVPCHRVVNRDGRIAENFAFGGTKGQRERLKKEKVEFIDKIHVNLEKHLWDAK